MTQVGGWTGCHCERQCAVGRSRDATTAEAHRTNLGPARAGFPGTWGSPRTRSRNSPPAGRVGFLEAGVQQGAEGPSDLNCPIPSRPAHCGCTLMLPSALPNCPSPTRPPGDPGPPRTMAWPHTVRFRLMPNHSTRAQGRPAGNLRADDKTGAPKGAFKILPEDTLGLWSPHWALTVKVLSSTGCHEREPKGTGWKCPEQPSAQRGCSGCPPWPCSQAGCCDHDRLAV